MLRQPVISVLLAAFCAAGSATAQERPAKTDNILERPRPLAASKEQFLAAALVQPSGGACQMLSPHQDFIEEMLLDVSSIDAPGGLRHERRIALVVGNGAYQSVSALKNPRNDAASMANMFRALGFTVYRAVDATERSLDDCFARFKGDLERSDTEGRTADIALFYYAGHGVQLTSQVDNEKRNYMLSIDASVDASGGAKGFRQVDKVLAEMRAHSKQAVFLYDACRNAPYGSGAVRQAEGQPVRAFDASGAAPIEVSQSANTGQAGLFIAYATSPGKTADDSWGPAGSRHSPFTDALLQSLPTPGATLDQALTAAHDTVKTLTQAQQTPRTDSSLIDPVTLNGDIEKRDLAAKSADAAAQSDAARQRGERGKAIAAALKGMTKRWPEGQVALAFRNAAAALSRAYTADVAFAGHIVAVEDAQFNADETRIVTTSWDQTAKVWDARTGQLLRTLSGHGAQVASARFSPDGAKIATGSNDQSVMIWDARTGSQIRTLRGHQGSVQSVAFSPDGTMLATAASDGKVKFWDVQTGEERRTLSGHTSQIYAVSFSPDGGSVATASIDGSARLWNAATGAQYARFGEMRDLASVDSVILASAQQPLAPATPPPEEEVPAAAEAVEAGPEAEFGFLMDARFSPDGRSLATANSWLIRVWNIETRTELSRFANDLSPIEAIAFSPDGARLAAGLQDGTAIIWTIASRETQRLKKHSGYVNSLAFDKGGRRLLTSSRDGLARLWSLDRAKPLAFGPQDQAVVYSVAFSPTDEALLVANGTAASLWSADAAFEKSVTGQSGAFGATFSPDGTRIATATEGEAAVWNRSTGENISRLKVPGVRVFKSEFSPDGRRVASALFDRSIRIWDSATGAELKKLEGHCVGAHHDCFVNSAKYSPNGAQLVTASMEGTVRLWNAATWAEIRSFAFPQSGVTSAQFAPDGERLLVTLAVDRTARVLDPQSGQFLGEYAGHEGASPGDPYGGGAFSPDGLRLLVFSGGPEVRLWDFVTNTEIERIGEKTVVSAAFDRRSRRLAIGAADGARIIDIGPYGADLLTAAYPLLTDELRNEVERYRIRYWEVAPQLLE